MNRFIRQWLNERTLEGVDALRPVAEQAGLTLSQLALAWVLHQRNVTAVIVGATRPEQVRENVAASDAKLSDDTLNAIDDALRTAVVS
jgi:aryl-alcohol dehydrogenase-like predicted oxidoreductase